jgi:hypothetical protein
MNSEGKDSMSKKTASTIEYVLNNKVEPISGKWYTDNETYIFDHQPMQGKIDNNLEQRNNECSSTSGVLDTLKAQDTKQKCDCKDISVVHIVDRKSLMQSKTLLIF